MSIAFKCATDVQGSQVVEHMLKERLNKINGIKTDWKYQVCVFVKNMAIGPSWNYCFLSIIY